MKSYKELIVWQKSYRLTTIVYEVTKKFPKEELYGLISQMRRATLVDEIMKMLNTLISKLKKGDLLITDH